MIKNVHDFLRNIIIFIFKPFIKILEYFNASPNFISITGFLINFAVLYLLAKSQIFIAGFVILFAGLFDMLDGYIARNQNKVTKFGALLDSTLDRYSELIIFLGLGIYYYKLQNPMVLLAIFFTISGSLLISYVRARAEGLGLDCKVGLIQRPERVVLLALGCFLPTGSMQYILYFLALSTNFTVIQRILHVWKVSNSK